MAENVEPEKSVATKKKWWTWSGLVFLVGVILLAMVGKYPDPQRLEGSHYWSKALWLSKVDIEARDGRIYYWTKEDHLWCTVGWTAVEDLETSRTPALRSRLDRAFESSISLRHPEDRKIFEDLLPEKTIVDWSKKDRWWQSFRGTFDPPREKVEKYMKRRREVVWRGLEIVKRYDGKEVSEKVRNLWRGRLETYYMSRGAFGMGKDQWQRAQNSMEMVRQSGWLNRKWHLLVFEWTYFSVLLAFLIFFAQSWWEWVRKKWGPIAASVTATGAVLGAFILPFWLGYAHGWPGFFTDIHPQCLIYGRVLHLMKWIFAIGLWPPYIVSSVGGFNPWIAASNYIHMTGDLFPQWLYWPNPTCRDCILPLTDFHFSLAGETFWCWLISTFSLGFPFGLTAKLMGSPR